MIALILQANTKVRTLNVCSPSAPSPPSGVTVSQNGVGRVQVSWTPPSGEPAVTGYIVYYQQQDGEHTDTEMAAATATSTTITGLITGVTYSITMVATSSTLPSTVTTAETITIGMIWVELELYISYNHARKRKFAR